MQRSLLLPAFALTLAGFGHGVNAETTRTRFQERQVACEALGSVKYGDFMGRMSELQHVSQNRRYTKKERRAAKRELDATLACTRALPKR